jgi:hypothetical protein
VNYTEQKLTFAGIRHELTKETGDEKVLVPVLKDGEGEFIKDSWDIAVYVSLIWERDYHQALPTCHQKSAGQGMSAFL